MLLQDPVLPENVKHNGAQYARGERQGAFLQDIGKFVELISDIG